VLAARRVAADHRRRLAEASQQILRAFDLSFLHEGYLPRKTEHGAIRGRGGV
jgi:hypothetical protein